MSENSFTMDAHVFRDMLVGGIVATGKDKFLPVLTGLYFEWSEGEPVRVVSTDRYRLVIGESQINGVGSGEFLLSRDYATELVKVLPKKISGNVIVTLDPEGKHVTIAHHGYAGLSTREYVLIVGEFPKYRALIPKEYGSVGKINFNTKFLADIDKIPHDPKVPVSLNFVTENKPMVATYPEYNTITWSYMLMPVRLV